MRQEWRGAIRVYGLDILPELVVADGLLSRGALTSRPIILPLRLCCTIVFNIYVLYFFMVSQIQFWGEIY